MKRIVILLLGLLIISLTPIMITDIVVYNEEKNPLPNQFKKQAVSDAPSRIAIGKYFLSKGNEELIRFDLERYKHLYFREVHTYTKAEFDKYIEEKFAGGTAS